MNFEIINWKLEKTFEFKNFSESLDFVNKVGNIAETIWHHPDILIFNYKFVKIYLFTHDENKVSQKDYYLAEIINKI